MDLESLRIFAKLSETLSFSKTAQELNQQTSLISRRIAELEAALGVRLVNRTTRKVSLTEEGQAFFLEIAKGIEILETAVDSVYSTRSAPQGVLRVTSPVELGDYLLQKVMPGFYETYPLIKLEWDFSADSKNLVEMGFDVAIRAFKPHEESFIARKMGSTRFKAFVSPHFRLPKIDGLDLQKLSLLPWVIFDPVSKQKQRSVIQFCSDKKDYEFKPKSIVFKGNSLHAIKTVVCQGLGIGFLPEFIFEEEIKRGEITEFLPEIKWQPQVEFYVTYPSRQHLPPKTKAFVDWILSRTNLMNLSNSN